MRPRMQLSFLFDCDDVALPAVKLDPDTELARVVPADVEVRQRAGLHDVECSCDDGFYGLKMLKGDCHQRASPGAFLGRNGRKNAETPPRVPLALEGSRQHGQDFYSSTRVPAFWGLTFRTGKFCAQT